MTNKVPNPLLAPVIGATAALLPSLPYSGAFAYDEFGRAWVWYLTNYVLPGSSTALPTGGLDGGDATSSDGPSGTGLDGGSATSSEGGSPPAPSPPPPSPGAYSWPGTQRTAASGATADVQAAINASVDGDVVIIPNYTGSWSAITIAVDILLRAKNAGMVNITNAAGSADMISVAVGSAYGVCLFGINFNPGSATGRYINFNAGGTKLPMLGKCTFNVPDFQLLFAVDWNSGASLAWGCNLSSTETTTEGTRSGCFRYTGGLAWNALPTWGTLDSAGAQKHYVEDCTGLNIVNQMIDLDDRVRAVIRNNTFTNCQILTHGITSLAGGGREVEIYNNAWRYRQLGGVFFDVNRYIWIRAGTYVCHHNSFEKIDSGGFYATRDSIQHIAESLTRTGSFQPTCQLASDYLGAHWPGSGGNGTNQVSIPCRSWSNTGTGATKPHMQSTNDQSGGTQTCFPPAGNFSANVVLDGRDMLWSSDATAALPGYTPLVYPHPLKPALADNV